MRKGHFQLVQYIIEKGANIEAKMIITELLFILHVVKYLVSKGANKHGETSI